MTLEELIAKRKELLAQVADADAEMFAKIQEEIKKVDYQIEETEKQEENERKAAAVDAEKRAARKANPSVDGAKDNVTLFRILTIEKVNRKKIELKKIYGASYLG